MARERQAVIEAVRELTSLRTWRCTGRAYCVCPGEGCAVGFFDLEDATSISPTIGDIARHLERARVNIAKLTPGLVAAGELLEVSRRPIRYRCVPK